LGPWKGEAILLGDGVDTSCIVTWAQGPVRFLDKHYIGSPRGAGGSNDTQIQELQDFLSDDLFLHRRVVEGLAFNGMSISSIDVVADQMGAIGALGVDSEHTAAVEKDLQYLLSALRG